MCTSTKVSSVSMDVTTYQFKNRSLLSIILNTYQKLRIHMIYCKS